MPAYSVHRPRRLRKTAALRRLVREMSLAQALGVGGVLLFGIPDRKDATGSEVWNDRGPVQDAVRALKAECQGLVVMTDVCMCE